MIRVKVLDQGTVPVSVDSPKELNVETKGTIHFVTDVDYNTLKNKPSINECTLVGEKSLGDIGIHPMTNMEIDKLINDSLGGI